LTVCFIALKHKLRNNMYGLTTPVVVWIDRNHNYKLELRLYGIDETPTYTVKGMTL
jgi:hypothetical protein